MIRKTLAVTAATALAMLAVPAAPALASATADARLTAGQAVFPGAASFSVVVKNNEAGGLLVGGTAINTVRVNFPVSEAGIGLAGTGAAPAGWTATVTDLGSTEYITYRGGSIAPGGMTTFNFPAAVSRPSGSDRRGDFRVQVSSNDAQSFSSARAPEGSTLFSTVKVLEIVSGSVKPTAPIDGSRGVGDRSGTAGQNITYSLDVVNHASGPVSVTPALASGNPTDVSGTAAATAIPGNDTKQTLSVPLQLGSAPAGGERSTVLTASANGTSGTGSSAAATLDDTFKVQAPVTFTATELTPLRTKSGQGSARDFQARVAKSGVQGATVSTSTLRFGNNNQAAGPLSYAGGAGAQTVQYKFLSVAGNEGANAATITNVGTDDNLFPLSGTPVTAGEITIDNTPLDISVDAVLPKDGDGDQQNASSNNDVVTVSGTVTGTDLDPATLAVKLVSDKGRELPVSVKQTANANGVTYSGTVNVGTWDKDDSSFTPSASMRDLALNDRTTSGVSYRVDTVAPVLRKIGTILTPTEIELKFVDAGKIRGGCDPRSYSISGKPGAVTAVRGNGSAPCDPSLTSDGVRTLVLDGRAALGTTELPTVTYSNSRLLGTLVAKDDAGNDAASATIDTVSNLTPLAPQLTLVERKDGSAFEAAYLDKGDNRYYTNAPGDQGNRVTVSGVRNGYVLQVRATPNGTPLSETATFSNSSPLAPSEYNGTVNLPVGDADGSVVRYLTFFVPATGQVSPATVLNVVLDRALPTLAGTVKTSDTSARTTFSEPIVAGTDAADDWFVTEKVNTESGTADRTVNVNVVTAVDERTRDLSFDLVDAARFARVDYFFQNPGGTRYEDRAGNLLASTLAVG